MSIAVIGCGRSGTNMALEILRGNSHLNATKEVENKLLCRGDEVYPGNYLTKCDTHYFTYPELKKMMVRNQNMKIVWTIRDPRDMCMSKLRRGVPITDGGDNVQAADDSTPEGCLQDLKKMTELYKKAIIDFENRIILVKMEDMITNTAAITRELCNELDLPFEQEMLDFPVRMRNKFKRARYKSIDRSQIGLWKNWTTAYNGFFVVRHYDMKEMFHKVDPLVRYFGYETA